MWKKAFIRLVFVALVVAGGILVVAASHTGKILKSECQATEDGDTKARGEFIIWESLSRTVMANVH